MKKILILASLFFVISIKTMDMQKIYAFFDVESNVLDEESNVGQLKKYKCSREDCGYQNSRPFVIENHTRIHRQIDDARNQNREIKYYQCLICGYLVLQRNSFDRHKFAHQEEKKYVCNLCPSKYKYSDSLRRHRKEKHKLPVFCHANLRAKR